MMAPCGVDEGLMTVSTMSPGPARITHFPAKNTPAPCINPQVLLRTASDRFRMVERLSLRNMAPAGPESSAVG